MKIVQDSLLHRVCCVYGRYAFDCWDKEPSTICGFIFWFIWGLLSIFALTLILTTAIIIMLECPLILTLQMFTSYSDWYFFGTNIAKPAGALFAVSSILWFAGLATCLTIYIVENWNSNPVTDYISYIWRKIINKLPTLSCSMVEYVQQKDEKDDFTN